MNWYLDHPSMMRAVHAPYVVAADRLDGDVVIEFEDGKCGVYSSDLLYAALANARPIETPNPGAVQNTADPDGAIKK